MHILSLADPLGPTVSSQGSGSDSNTLLGCRVEPLQCGSCSSGLIVSEAHRGALPSRSVRSCHHEQNSVSKAGDPIARMIQHGMTRDRPVHVGYSLCLALEHAHVDNAGPAVVAVPPDAGPHGPVEGRSHGFPIGTEESIRRSAYCVARGEILRPTHDELKRRRCHQGCVCQSRTRVWGAKMIRYRCSPLP